MLYQYRAYLETLLTYGSDAVVSHLTNAFRCRDTGVFYVCDKSAAVTATTNTTCIARCDNLNMGKEIEMVGCLNTDICNIPTHLLPGVKTQLKLAKAKGEFYLMSKAEDSKVVFKILDAQLLVKRVRQNPAYLIAHNTALQAGAIAKYKLTKVEYKTFTYTSGSQSLSIENATLGPTRQRLLFVMIDYKENLGSLDTNPFEFHHYDMVLFHCTSMAKRFLVAVYT